MIFIGMVIVGVVVIAVVFMRMIIFIGMIMCVIVRFRFIINIQQDMPQGHTGGNHDDRKLFFCLQDLCDHTLFVPGAIQEYQVGAQQFCHISGAHVFCMGIRSGRDQCVDFQYISSHLRRHIGQNAMGGKDVNIFLSAEVHHPQNDEQHGNEYVSHGGFLPVRSTRK